MRGVRLMDIMWVAHIEYKNHSDSKLKFPAVEYPTFLAAVAKIHSHCQECWPYEIISLAQERIR